MGVEGGREGEGGRGRKGGMRERKLLEKVFKADCLFKAILQDDDGGV